MSELSGHARIVVDVTHSPMVQIDHDNLFTSVPLFSPDGRNVIEMNRDEYPQL